MINPNGSPRARQQLIVASHRSPVQLRECPKLGARVEAAPGGLASALGWLLAEPDLTWVAAAWGQDGALVSLASGKREAGRLHWLRLPQDVHRWFYRGFCNPVLWFLQHGLWHLLRRSQLESYVAQGWAQGYLPANRSFARAIVSAAGDNPRPTVLVQDYHLYLTPALVRAALPEARIAHFVHVPWPGPDEWERLPTTVRINLCTGLLGADQVGFQTETSAVNFLRCCDRFLPEARVDFRGLDVRLGNHRTRVGTYPVPADASALTRASASTEVGEARASLERLRSQKTIVRVDRVDPSKNVALGFRAFGRLLERRPDLVGSVRFLAFLVPSRSDIAEYRRYAQEVWRELEAVNSRFGRDGWKPIEVFYEDNRAQALAGLQIYDVLLVNAVADGMNLVAKEGALVNQRDGVLALSRGAGAFSQIGAWAVPVEPEDLDQTALALERALDMPQVERQERAARLRARLQTEDLRQWLDQQLADLPEATAAQASHRLALAG